MLDCGGFLRLSGGALVKNKTSLSVAEEAWPVAEAWPDAEDEDDAEHDRRPARTMGFGALMARRDAAKRAGVSANAGDARIPCTICLAVSGLSISAEMRDASIGSAVPVPAESVTKSITHSEIVRRARLHGETGEKSDRLELWPAPAAPAPEAPEA